MTLSLKQKDILAMIQSQCHRGSINYNIQMRKYISNFEQKVPIFNLEETYNKIRLAAAVIAAIPDIKNVMAVSSRVFGQRAIVKFSHYTGCTVSASDKWIPGQLSNRGTKKFVEPEIIIVVDPYADFKVIKEASYSNIPVIALCDSNNNLKYVDIAIPCNNNSTHSIGFIFWMLTREVLYMKKQRTKQQVLTFDKDVRVDLYYYKDIDEIVKNQKKKELEETADEFNRVEGPDEQSEEDEFVKNIQQDDENQ